MTHRGLQELFLASLIGDWPSEMDSPCCLTSKNFYVEQFRHQFTESRGRGASDSNVLVLDQSAQRLVIIRTSEPDDCVRQYPY